MDIVEKQGEGILDLNWLSEDTGLTRTRVYIEYIESVRAKRDLSKTERLLLSKDVES